jgi:hypothetical protein
MVGDLSPGAGGVGRSLLGSRSCCEVKRPDPRYGFLPAVRCGIVGHGVELGVAGCRKQIWRHGLQIEKKRAMRVARAWRIPSWSRTRRCGLVTFMPQSSRRFYRHRSRPRGKSSSTQSTAYATCCDAWCHVAREPNAIPASQRLILMPSRRQAGLESPNSAADVVASSNWTA